MTMDRESQLATLAFEAGINDPTELANFMAQVGHESSGLTRLEESFRYTRDIAQIPVRSAWREGPEALEAARQAAVKGKPEALAELMYGGRLGNDTPGDGYRYRGRGYIQLTGKDNYRNAAEELGLDLLQQPDLTAEPAIASKIAIWYWENRVPPSSRLDVKAATLAINGGYNGLDDRERRFVAWGERLTPAVIRRLIDGLGVPPYPTQTPRVLKEGLSGDDVRTLQADLARLGYTDARARPLVVDGVFGTGTKAAVQAFQRDQKLDADGIAGPTTLRALAKQLTVKPCAIPRHKQCRRKCVPA